MKVEGKPRRSIWLESDGQTIGIIDQTFLPHEFVTRAEGGPPGGNHGFPCARPRTTTSRQKRLAVGRQLGLPPQGVSRFGL